MIIGKMITRRKNDFYRGIDDIAEVIRDTVKIDKIIKPVYNYKAGGTL